mmetsp:Transcript_18589/g.51886  ORF Transcript_18589/g.51886 Transcript_18589/m.51886 type:complete len:285 (+) Transcript_18589:732-1586(+)
MSYRALSRRAISSYFSFSKGSSVLQASDTNAVMFAGFESAPLAIFSLISLCFSIEKKIKELLNRLGASGGFFIRCLVCLVRFVLVGLRFFSSSGGSRMRRVLVLESSFIMILSISRLSSAAVGESPTPTPTSATRSAADSVIVVWSSLPSVMESLKPMLPSTRGSITLLYPSLPTALPTVSNGQDSRLARIDGFDVRFYAAKRTDSDRSVGCSCKLLLRTTYVFYYFSINKTTGGAARVLLPLLSTERTVSVRVVCVVSLCVVCLYVLCVLCVCMYGLCVLCVL